MATADPCLVTTTVSVSPGSNIDVGTRGLEIANHGALSLTSGTMTLHAGVLTVDLGGKFSLFGGEGKESNLPSRLRRTTRF